MSSLIQEISRANSEMRNGKKLNKAVTKIEGSVRNNDVMGFVEGDVIQIPTDFTNRLYEQEFGNGKAYYCLVNTNGVMVDDANGNKIEGDIRRFYPSSLTKIAFPVNELGMPTGEEPTRASGTAAQFYKDGCGNNYGDVNDALTKGLAGKKIKVTGRKAVRVLSLNQNATGPVQTRNTYVCQFDLVD